MRIVEKKGLIGFILSLLFHCFFMFGVGSLFYKKAEYAMGGALGYSQVDLIEGTAATQKEETQPQLPEVAQTQKEEVSKPEDFSLVEKKKEEPKPALAVPRSSTINGQGKLGKGKNTRTLVRGTSSGGGGVTSAASPDYLHNPIPPYPEECRCRGQEGLVILKVCVSPEGKPMSVQLSKSSGFVPMDKSALETVQRWKFNPAKMAGVPVTSYVIVPIRFKLLNE
ncbi:energy transducer TonB [Methylacidiphilum caldifontis]|uniref:Energy transducer TonB n=1 Tax=Methylacidiphilum caldifontis TaxID=2795386 RepID=A0A4Y8PGQ1_9BACT|nr:energy transducer TonB [Methylacidiphilum caldifontis]TFE71157.1 energy transducer TonB [Methylacidiphilum caldifontis]